MWRYLLAPFVRIQKMKDTILLDKHGTVCMYKVCSCEFSHAWSDMYNTYL